MHFSTLAGEATDIPDTELPAPDPADLARLRPARGRVVRWLVPGLLGLLGVAVAVPWMLADDAAAWQTEAVTRETLTLVVTAVGQLEPEHSVEVGSDLSGRLDAVLVEENAEVDQGEVLAQLDAAPFQHAVTQAKAQLRSARAQVAGAEAELADAERERDRVQRLLDRGASARADLLEAELAVQTLTASLDAARASRDQAAASLADAEADLADTTITAPIDGVVIHRYVDPGQTVVSSTAATALFEVASDLSRLTVEVGVDEGDIGSVAAGQAARFSVAAYPGEVFDAHVVGVDLAPDPDEDVVTYNTDLVVDNADGRLRPGMTATAEITVHQLEEALTVPTLALRYRPERGGGPPGSQVQDPIDGERVYVLRDGRPVGVPVELLGSDGVRTAVSGDLQEGDALVIGGGA